MVFSKKTIIFQDSRGSNFLFGGWSNFSEGGPNFSRGVQLLVPIEIVIFQEES